MPEHLEKRDSFVSKFYETLTLAKAAAASLSSTSSCPSDYTSRLHVAELELFCNVYTAGQYRDVLYKGDVVLLYTSGGATGQATMDMTPFARLPLFAGMIQSTDSGLRVILKGKSSLNDAANTALSGEEENRFLDADAFQIHITELGKLIPRLCYSNAWPRLNGSTLADQFHSCYVSRESSMDSLSF